jgi:acylphosphatase
MSVLRTSASQKNTRRFTITGRVQGVFFRDSTRRVAESLALVGHAINLSDGSVEVLACGEADALASLEKWLHEGPPQASVTAVIDHGPEENSELCGDSFRTR